jgi:cytidine deaminase
VPYSKYPVGAALLCSSGKVYPGCNVENAAYSVCMCAERTALFSAVAAGETEFVAMAVIADSDRPVPPCGMCRQALVEFAPRLPIVSYTKHGGEATWNLATLLPHPFTPAALTHHQ